MKLTKEYLRKIIKETIQYGSTIDIMKTLKDNLPIIANSELVLPTVAELCNTVLENLKSFQRMFDRGEDISKYVSSSIRQDLYKILSHIQDLYASRIPRSEELNKLAIAYNNLLEVKKILA